MKEYLLELVEVILALKNSSGHILKKKLIKFVEKMLLKTIKRKLLFRKLQLYYQNMPEKFHLLDHLEKLICQIAHGELKQAAHEK